MSWVVPLSTSNEVQLNAGENLYVADDVDIYTNSAPCVFTGYSNEQIIIEGKLITGGTFAAGIGDLPESNSHNTIAIGSTARILSLNDSGEGVFIWGLDNSFDNAGFISGGRYGLGIDGHGDGLSTFSNSGTIQGGQVGVARGWSDVTDTVSFANSGTIEGAMAYLGSDTAAGVDQITNTGKMLGGIDLGAGDDSYHGSDGYADGTIDGGAGADTIFAGKENDTILGGTGNDSISGGLGADELTGGGDSDVFLFGSAKDSTVKLKGQDTITDFTHGTDTIDMQSFDINAKKSGIQHLHWIGTKDFSHTAGELRYERAATETYVYADTNGDGKTDFELHLTGAMTLSSHDFLL